MVVVHCEVDTTTHFRLLLIAQHMNLKIGILAGKLLGDALDNIAEQLKADEGITI